MKQLKANHACYVLITCSEPSKSGDMEVEMNYEGDDVLVSYLVDSASEVLTHNFEETKDKCGSNLV